MLSATRWLYPSLTLVVLGTAAAAAPQEEWEASTSFYEDDAWLDVTEWFDGNDYNPTDEKVFRWDNEVYGNDWDYDSSWGFDDEATEDDWFYDYYTGVYYDPYDLDHDGFHEYSYHYHDYDGDGLYDAFDYMYDVDQDGIYDGIEYYPLHAATADMTSKDRGSSRHVDSTAHSVSGKVAKKKTVEVRDGENLVVMLKGDDKAVVDLGDADGLEELGLTEGKEIEATGPMSKVGDQRVLFARRITVDGESHDVERASMELEGVVADTRKTKVRGTERTFVILGNGDDKKWLVDLGPAKEIAADLEQGQELVVEGIPFRQGEHKVLMALSCEKDGQELEIGRYLERKDRAQN